MKKIFFAAFLLLPFAAMAQEPESIGLKYDAYFMGLAAGEMLIRFDEKDAGYKANVTVNSLGLVKEFTNYWAVAMMEGRVESGNYNPEIYDNKWGLKKGGTQEVVVNYAKNGDAIETANPPENRSKRPFVEQNMKRGLPDPVTAGWLARRKVMEIINGGTALPQSFKIRVFDSRRVFDLNFAVIGYVAKKFNGQDGNFLNVKMARTPVAGFNLKELEKLKQIDPSFDGYLNDDFILVYATAKAPLGTATINLAKSCKGEGCQL